MDDWFEELREHWQDRYWWIDHPELSAILLAIAGGLIELTFAWLRLLLHARYQTTGG